MTSNQPRVGISKSECESSDSEIEEAVFKAVESIGGIPETLQTASRILVKPNIGYLDTRTHKGRLIALSEPCITAAVLRMIRDTNKNDIIIGEGPSPRSIDDLARKVGYQKILKDYDVKLVDTNQGPYMSVDVPGGGMILRRYELNKEIASADATVSIAKLKSHLLTGVSLCMKNLFGLPPIPVYGYWHARWYLHYPVRLPRCLVDLTSIFRPSLNIIDGIVGEDVQEWDGQPIESNVILAGNNTVATDAIGAMVMGFDPQAEFPKTPFQFDVSHLRLGAAKGLGPIDHREISTRGERIRTVQKKFRVRYLGGIEPSRHLSARKQLIADAQYYREHLREIGNEYSGKIVGLQNRKVQWVTDSMEEVKKNFKPHELTVKYNSPGAEYVLPFIKKVESQEDDPEVYDAYFKP